MYVVNCKYYVHSNGVRVLAKNTSPVNHREYHDDRARNRHILGVPRRASNLEEQSVCLAVLLGCPSGRTHNLSCFRVGFFVTPTTNVNVSTQPSRHPQLSLSYHTPCEANKAAG